MSRRAVSRSASGRNSLDFLDALKKLPGLSWWVDGRKKRSPSRQRRKPCSVVVIDLKGDDLMMYSSLRHAGKLARQRLGIQLPLQHFSNEINVPTYAWNPFRHAFLKELTLGQRADILSTGLGVAYGGEYGPAFYSSANRGIAEAALEVNPHPKNVVEFYYIIDRLLRTEKGRGLLPDEKRAGLHVKMVAKSLAQIEQLCVAPGDKYDQGVINESIDLGQAFEEPRLYYFRLSTGRGRSAAKEIARLVMFWLITAANCVKRKTQVFVIIDEAAEIAAGSEAFGYLLRQARSMDIGITLAHQSIEDLRRGDDDLIPVVQTNTRLTQWCSVNSVRDLEYLRAVSGETVDQRYVFTENTQGNAATRSTVVIPRLTDNKIHFASDDPYQSILHVKRSGIKGYAQYQGVPFISEGDWIIPESESKRRQSFGLEEGPGTFRATRDYVVPSRRTKSRPKGQRRRVKRSGQKKPPPAKTSSTSSVTEAFEAFFDGTKGQSPERK